MFKFPAIATVFAAVLCWSTATFAGSYVRVSPDLDIYYEEAGSGRPIIFIPGWTGTTAYLRKQVAHFSKRHRAIVYDPRSQGRSSKTPENNTYTQHGADLKALMDALKLKDVVLVGHSWGCYDAYAYFRAFGADNVKGYVCLDQSPKDIIEKDGDWGSIRTLAEFKTYYDSLAYNRMQSMRDFIQSLFTRPLTEEEKALKLDETLKTPTSAAVALQYDGYVADYTPEAKAIESKIPVLNIVYDPGWYKGWAQAAQNWGKTVATRTEVVVMPGLHNLHWENPEQVNAVIDKFLEKVK